jgi:hypothetical protein
MCQTNYINNLLATIPSSPLGRVQISMKRSDGELFIANLQMLTDGEAEKIKKLVNYFEELRTCLCTRNSVCEKHSSLQKV